MNRNSCRMTASSPLVGSAFRLATPLAIVALALGVLTPSVSVADEVTDWNQILVSALTATNTSPQNSGRIAAITQAAVFDAVNGIRRRYTPYFITQAGPPGASRRAAAVQAAYVVLKTLLPLQAPGLERQRDASIATIKAEESVESGIAWGEFVATELLEERSTDGFPAGGEPDFGSLEVGKWRPETPGTPAVTPWLAVLTPFVMTSPDHFRPGGPPALNSAAYASDFEEVKRLGRATGSSRTPDQTVIAFFWTDNTISHWNRIAVSIALQRRTRLSENARLFALLNLAMADAGIAVWDAKFVFRFWRPFSAIPLAGDDGNPSTTADPDWKTLVSTPNHQEYPSGHGGLSGAAAHVLGRIFRDKSTFTHRTDTAPFAPRTHRRFSAAADEANNSRVYAGIHFRSAVRAGRLIGDNVGRLAMQTLMLRVHDDHHDHDDDDDEDEH
jgi:membrane-associated phospholipid phosphatase